MAKKSGWQGPRADRCMRTLMLPVHDQNRPVETALLYQVGQETQAGAIDQSRRNRREPAASVKRPHGIFFQLHSAHPVIDNGHSVV